MLSRTKCTQHGGLARFTVSEDCVAGWGAIQLQVFHVVASAKQSLDYVFWRTRVWTTDKLLVGTTTFAQCAAGTWKLTALHLFSDCLTSKTIWREIARWCCSSLDPTQWKAGVMMDWFHDLARGSNSSTTEGIRLLSIIVAWSLWHERNARVFNDQEKPTSRITSEKCWVMHLAGIVFFFWEN